MMYLVDTSALVRIIRRQVNPEWSVLIDRGLLSICEPAMTETLLLAETKNYSELEHLIADRYPPVTIPDGIWDLVAAIRRDLAPHSAHRGLSVADLVIAATAIRLKLTVLHEDADYETVARLCRSCGNTVSARALKAHLDVVSSAGLKWSGRGLGRSRLRSP